MTPDQLALQARTRYNAVGDSFFSDTELYNLMYEAQLELSMEAICIESAQTTTTVASQREYAKPTNAISIKRVTYNGQALLPIDFMDDDAVTGFSETTTASGTPTYYSEWGDSLFLRPIPNDALTLKVYFHAKPQEVSASADLDIPSEYHLFMIDFLLEHMFGKDGKDQMAAYHQAKWQKSKERVQMWEARRRRGDKTAAVKNLDAYSELSTIV